MNVCKKNVIGKIKHLTCFKNCPEGGTTEVHRAVTPPNRTQVDNSLQTLHPLPHRNLEEEIAK